MNYNFNKKLLKRVMKEKKISREQLATLLTDAGLDISLNGVNYWFRDENNKPEIEKAKAISEILDIPFDKLVSQDIFVAQKNTDIDNDIITSEISEIQSNNIATKQDYLLHKKQPDTIYVPFFKDGLASAGKGIINFDTGDYDYIPFKESDLKLMFNVNPKSKLGIIPCAGNSMEPTIKEGDLIVFQQDFSQIEGAIYVCRYDDELFVKRLRKRPKIALISDNKDYEPIEINEAENIDILGRVVGCYSIKSKQI